jgi:hypothetical protein
LYSSGNTVILIKSRKIRRSGHITPVEQVRETYKRLAGENEMEEQLGELGVGGREI